MFWVLGGLKELASKKVLRSFDEGMWTNLGLMMLRLKSTGYVQLKE